MAKELWQFSATEAADLYRRREATPTQVLDAHIDRLETVNSRINAFATLDLTGAREQAAASTRRWNAQTARGPLDGVVLTIKDNIAVQGLPCMWGSEAFRDFVPERDETPVAILREAGGIILGKTTVSEFTVAQTTVNTRLCGTTRNPWNLALTTGASSGGAVAALAAGIGQVALGTDGGGSIRRPASHCGLVGLKPSTGRVARRHGLPVVLDDCEVIGPIARTCDDLALVFRAIAQPHPEDRASLLFSPETSAGAPPARCRILYVPRIGNHPVDAEVEASCAEAADRLRALGHHVVGGLLPFDFELYEKHWPAIRDAGLAWGVRERNWQGRVSTLHDGMIRRGQTLSAVDYIDALTAFREIQAQFGRFFQTFDILMMPSAGCLPWAAEQEGPAANRVFTGIVNAAGYPAISIPSESASNGLPIGFQLVGAFGADWLLIALASAYERQHPWAQRWPEL